MVLQYHMIHSCLDQNQWTQDMEPRTGPTRKSYVDFQLRSGSSAPNTCVVQGSTVVKTHLCIYLLSIFAKKIDLLF